MAKVIDRRKFRQITSGENDGRILRPMAQSDVSQVTEIEREAFSDPWPRYSFRECLRYGYCCRVLEADGEIQAYGIIAVDPFNAHILNLCVRPQLRNEGLGRRMLSHLLDEARASDAEQVFLEVRSSNEAAIHLYRSMGFLEIGMRKGYYRKGRGQQHEDALVFALVL